MGKTAKRPRRPQTTQCVALAMLLVLTTSTGLALAEPVESPVSSAGIGSSVRDALRGVVRIEVVATHPVRGRLTKVEKSGSGAIFSSEGYVITNHHVAAQAKRINCRLFDGQEVKATLVGTDALADIAVVKLDRSTMADPSAPLPVLAFGETDDVRVGQTVYALGSPMALTQSITRGIVSNDRMVLPKQMWQHTLKLDGEQPGSLVRWIGHDARIYGGNSGGPLVDGQGRIIGINEIGIGSLAGAIPGKLAHEVARQLIQHGEVPRSWTGLRLQPRIGNEANGRGALVRSVIPDSPADKAGIVPGDQLLRFDDMPTDCGCLEELPPLNGRLLSTPIGKRVSVVIAHRGEEKTLTLTTVGRGTAQAVPAELKQWGMVVRDLTMLGALERKRPNTNGVLVDGVDSGRPAAKAKPPLQSNDVIIALDGQAIDSVSQLVEAAREAMQKETKANLLVAFQRKGQELLTIVSPKAEPDVPDPRLARKVWLPADVQVLDDDLAKTLGLGEIAGVRITRVHSIDPDSPSGFSVGDVIVRINGNATASGRHDDLSTFHAELRRCRNGQQAKFDILRNGKPLELSLELGLSPKPASEQKDHEDEDLEFTARNLSFDDRDTRQLGPEVQGVVVAKVPKGGNASLALMVTGDILLEVDGKPVPDVHTLQETLDAIKRDKPERIVFFVRRGIHTMFLKMEPLWEESVSKPRA